MRRIDAIVLGLVLGAAATQPALSQTTPAANQPAVGQPAPTFKAPTSAARR